MLSQPPTLTPPTEAQIKDTVQAIRKRLTDPAIKKPINRPVREGYEEAVNILVEDRRTYEGIDDKLNTVQARAIAVLAVDYLLGDCSKVVLLGVGLK